MDGLLCWSSARFAGFADVSGELDVVTPVDVTVADMIEQVKVQVADVMMPQPTAQTGSFAASCVVSRWIESGLLVDFKSWVRYNSTLS